MNEVVSKFWVVVVLVVVVVREPVLVEPDVVDVVPDDDRAKYAPTDAMAITMMIIMTTSATAIPLL